MTFEGADQRTSFKIPKLDCMVAVGGNHMTPIWGYDNFHNSSGITFKYADP